jgi:proteic killer suppression protein
LLNRKGEYAMDLVQPYRLVFEKTGEEIQVAKILEIVDYH